MVYEHGYQLGVAIMTNEQRELFHGWRPLEQDHEHQGSISVVPANCQGLGVKQQCSLFPKLFLLQELFSFAL
jgi:hypothetical protein